MRDLTPKKHELEPIEIASIDEIKALQLVRLKWSIDHAYKNVAFYKKKYDEIGIHPSDLKYLEDIKLFPLQQKKILERTIHLICLRTN